MRHGTPPTIQYLRNGLDMRKRAWLGSHIWGERSVHAAAPSGLRTAAGPSPIAAWAGRGGKGRSVLL